MVFRFFRDENGAVAPLFALSLIPIIGAVGAGVDFGREIMAEKKNVHKTVRRKAFLSRVAAPAGFKLPAVSSTFAGHHRSDFEGETPLQTPRDARSR